MSAPPSMVAWLMSMRSIGSRWCGGRCSSAAACATLTASGGRPHVEQQRQVLLGHDEPAERALDGDFTDDCCAEQDAVGVIGEVTLGLLPQALIAAEKPESGMRVQQQLQQAPNA